MTSKCIFPLSYCVHEVVLKNPAAGALGGEKLCALE